MVKHTCLGTRDLCQNYHGIDASQVTAHWDLATMSMVPSSNKTNVLSASPVSSSRNTFPLHRFINLFDVRLHTMKQHSDY